MAPPLFRTNLQAAGYTTRPQVRQTRRFDRSTASGRVGGSTARPASGRTFALRPTPGFQSRLKSTRAECLKSTQKPLDRKRSSFGSTTDSRFSKSTPGFSESTRLKSTPTACLGVDSGHWRNVTNQTRAFHNMSFSGAPFSNCFSGAM